MTEVQLEPNDRDDILQLLDYALEKKIEENDKNIPPAYWKLRVPQLKKLINGINIYDTIYQSSLGGLVKDIVEGLDEDNY